MISLYSSMNQSIQLKQWIFPGGEVGVKIDQKIDPDDDYFIKIDGIPTSDDIMKAVNIADALTRIGVGSITLFAPYFPYARQDRVCHEGESFALEVFIKILSASGIHNIFADDLHSKVSKDMIEWHGMKIYDKDQYECAWNLPCHDIFIAPDKGAENKIMNNLHVKAGNAKVVCLSKSRTESGVVYDDYPFDTIKGEVCVIDDICDGGATFLSLGDMLKRTQPNITKMNLYVTHGLFSNPQKFAECKQLYDTIFVYNLMNESFKDSVVVLQP